MSFVTRPETLAVGAMHGECGSPVSDSTSSQKLLLCARSHSKFCRGAGRVDSRRTNCRTGISREQNMR
jgi:hypothetical protein